MERTAVPDQIRDHLEVLIRSGRFAPGSALPPERELASDLGVSRHSLRQAIASLEAVGLVESRHGAGVFLTSGPSDAIVARFADAVIDQQRSLSAVVEARLGIEPFIARQAALRRTEADLDLLLRAVDVSAHLPDAEEASARTRMEFHKQVARTTRNPVLEGILRSLTTGPRSMRRLIARDPDCRDRWDTEHRAIATAVGQGDGERAAELMTTHMQGVLLLATPRPRWSRCRWSCSLD